MITTYRWLPQLVAERDNHGPGVKGQVAFLGAVTVTFDFLGAATVTSDQPSRWRGFKDGARPLNISTNLYLERL